MRAVVLVSRSWPFIVVDCVYACMFVCIFENLANPIVWVHLESDYTDSTVCRM